MLSHSVNVVRHPNTNMNMKKLNRQKKIDDAQLAMATPTVMAPESASTMMIALNTMEMTESSMPGASVTSMS